MENEKQVAMLAPDVVLALLFKEKRKEEIGILTYMKMNSNKMEFVISAAILYEALASIKKSELDFKALQTIVGCCRFIKLDARPHFYPMDEDRKEHLREIALKNKKEEK